MLLVHRFERTLVGAWTLLRGRQPIGPNAKTYAAFISYNRALDGKLAPALQSALHQFAKPWYQLRALRVFRDDASLAANPGLWSSIQGALANSEFFILLASPEAARSRWVAKEVDFWLTNKTPDNFLIALTAGEIVWNSDAGDFDWSRTNALPPSLGGKFSDEPRYIDLRWARTEGHLTLADGRFRDATADLAAPLHHQAKDNLVGADVRQHRRTIRVICSVIIVLTVLALLASTAAGVAIQQRQVALLQLNIALSRQLAADADLQASSNPQLAALLSIAAFKTQDTSEARSSLMHQLDRVQHIDRFLNGNGGPINSVAFSRDGRILASGGNGITLWDVDKGTPLTTLPGSVVRIAFSPDGKMLAAAGYKKGVLWDVARHIQLATFPGNSGPIAFSPDGHTLALGGTLAPGAVEYKIIFWDVVKHAQVASLPLPGDSGYSSLAFSPDGKMLAADGYVGGDIVLWDITRQTEIADLQGGHTRGVLSLAFSPDGKILASGGHDAKLVLWNVTQHTQLANFDATGDVLSLAFSPDGHTLATADAGKNVILWDVAGHKRLTTLIGHTAGVNSVAFSPDGSTLASGSDDNNIILWNLAGRNKLFLGSLLTHKTVSSLAFSPDGRILAEGEPDEVVLWDVARRTQLVTLPGAARLVTFSPDGHTLATADAGNDVILWDVAGYKRLTTLTDYTSQVTSLAFSPDGRILAASQLDKVILWDVAGYFQLVTFPDDSDEISSLAFSPDGKILAAGGLNIIFWDVAQGTKLFTLPGNMGAGTPVLSIAFSPDGHTFVSTAQEGAETTIGCAGCKVIIWDLTRRTEVVELSGHRYEPQSVSFSPDGQILASAGDKAILWSVGQYAQMTSLADGASLALFSPDGHILATNNFDPLNVGTSYVDLWNVSIASWLQILCQVVGRDLTQTEWASYLPPDRPYQPVCRL